MHRSLALGLFVVAMVIAAPAMRAAENVWSGLVIAENVAQPVKIIGLQAFVAVVILVL